MYIGSVSYELFIFYFLFWSKIHLDLFTPVWRRWKQQNRLGPGLLKTPNRKLPNYGPYELDATWATFDASINEERKREREREREDTIFMDLIVERVPIWMCLKFIG